MSPQPSNQQASHRQIARSTVAKPRLRRARRPAMLARKARTPTDDPALAYWFGTFYRFHTDSATYVPHALRMVTVSAAEKGNGHQPLAAGRYVVEVAEFLGAKAVQWIRTSNAVSAAWSWN